MNHTSRFLIIGICAVALSSCSTKILSTNTTLPGPTTTTTLPLPTGTSVELLNQLNEVVQGLGQAVVDGDNDTTAHKVAQTDAIWKALEPQIKASGVDLVEDVQRIVNLVHTSVTRKRPAEADKAARFLSLILETAPQLLK